MEKFKKLSRTEMKNVMGGAVDPEDEVECMSKTKGDDCYGGGQCISVRNKIPHDGFHLICRVIAMA